MPTKYIKKEKKIDNYKENSPNFWMHKILALFDDVTFDILLVKASSKRGLQNSLYKLDSQNKVRQSKVSDDNYIFRSYHFTDKFKERLFEKHPEEYPQFSTIEKRKVNAKNLIRSTKVSDTMAMGIMAGLVYDPRRKISLRKMSGAAIKEGKKEEKNSIEYGRQQTTSPSVWKSNLIQEYKDLSYSVNPNFIPNYDEGIDRKGLLRNGVVYASYEMGNSLRIDENDVNHNKFTSITGVLLLEDEAFCLYNAGQGNMSWFTGGETSQASTLGLVLSELYPKYGPIYRIPNCILFVRDIKHMKGVVDGIQKGPTLHMPGKEFERALLVPIKKEGVSLLWAISKYPEFCESVTELFLSAKGYVENRINAKIFPVTEKTNGVPCCMLFDMDIHKIREINRVIEESEHEKVIVVCFEWQVEWLKEVIPENSRFITIKDEAIQRIVNSHLKRKGIGMVNTYKN